MKCAAVRLLMMAMFVTLGLNLPAFAQAPIRAITPESITIYNFAKVNDDYYRGGQPIGEHYADLAAIGVKTVINLTNEDGLTGDQAFKEMKQHKYGPDFLHPEFKKFVQKYQPKTATAAAAVASTQQ